MPVFFLNCLADLVYRYFRENYGEWTDTNVSHDVRPDDRTPHSAPLRSTPILTRCVARFRRRGGGGDRGSVDGDGWHGDGSLEALRAGEIVECLGVW